MFEILTTDQMYEADRRTIEGGVPGDVLMQNAGRTVFEEIIRHWSPRSVSVLCGPGNNGGGGVVVVWVANGKGGGGGRGENLGVAVSLKKKKKKKK